MRVMGDIHIDCLKPADSQCQNVHKVECYSVRNFNDTKVTKLDEVLQAVRSIFGNIYCQQR